MLEMAIVTVCMCRMIYFYRHGMNIHKALLVHDGSLSKRWEDLELLEHALYHRLMSDRDFCSPPPHKSIMAHIYAPLDSPVRLTVNAFLNTVEKDSLGRRS